MAKDKKKYKDEIIDMPKKTFLDDHGSLTICMVSSLVVLLTLFKIFF